MVHYNTKEVINLYLHTQQATFTQSVTKNHALDRLLMECTAPDSAPSNPAVLYTTPPPLPKISITIRPMTTLHDSTCSLAYLFLPNYCHLFSHLFPQYAFICLLTHALTPSCIRSLTHAFTPSVLHLLAHSLT